MKIESNTAEISFENKLYLRTVFTRSPNNVTWKRLPLFTLVRDLEKKNELEQLYQKLIK